MPGKNIPPWIGVTDWCSWNAEIQPKYQNNSAKIIMVGIYVIYKRIKFFSVKGDNNVKLKSDLCLFQVKWSFNSPCEVQS